MIYSDRFKKYVYDMNHDVHGALYNGKERHTVFSLRRRYYLYIPMHDYFVKHWFPELSWRRTTKAKIIKKIHNILRMLTLREKFYN